MSVVGKNSSRTKGTQPHSIGYARRSEFYYDEFASFPDEVDFIESVTRVRGGNVLEVPCACGRLTVPLSRRVESITAVDGDPRMIQQLDRLLASQSIANVSTVIGDMRRLNLSTEYDLVVCPRESFQLLVDEVDATQALSSFRRHVAKRGCLILDLASFVMSSGALDDGPEYFSPGLEEKEVVPEWEKRLDNGSILRRSRSQRIRSDQVLELTFFYALTTGAITEEFVSTVELRIYSLSKVCDLLRGAGFRVLNAYGNYKGELLTARSARFVLLAEAA